jgi:hypothetical protein
MTRKVTLVLFSALSAVLAVTSANAADLAGKWYGKLDSLPLITITKAGAGYSAAMDYPDMTLSRQAPGTVRTWSMAVHKAIVSFDVSGNSVQFTIRNTISGGGEIDFVKDDYSLTLSGDQLIGTVRHSAGIDENLVDHSVPQAVTPITLFPTDFATRSQP